MNYLKPLQYSTSILKLTSLQHHPFRFFRKPSHCDVYSKHQDKRPFSTSVVKLLSIRYQPLINQPVRFYRHPSPCAFCLDSPDKRPCFDLRNLWIEPANTCHEKLIRSFLYTHYWTREPSIVGLWMPVDSQYLQLLTDKYTHLGDRFLAFEKVKRTNELKLIGVIVANQLWPWHINDLEEWACYTHDKPEKYHMYFTAHMHKMPKLFTKYNVPYIYDVEVLGTAAEVTGQGVGKALLTKLLEHSVDVRHPLVQVTAVSKYSCKICESVGMKREWSMDYNEFRDTNGQNVFYPRRPHHTVAVYSKYNDPQKLAKEPCKPPFL